MYIKIILLISLENMIINMIWTNGLRFIINLNWNLGKTLKLNKRRLSQLYEISFLLLFIIIISSEKSFEYMPISCNGHIKNWFFLGFFLINYINNFD